jgi:hypothetical protein
MDMCGMGKTDLKWVPDWDSGLCLTNITLGYGTTIIKSMVDSDNDIRYILRFNTPGNADKVSKKELEEVQSS